MNVKMIRELAFDCYTGKHHEFDEILFAEMIVKQCMKICEDQASLQYDAYRFDFVEHDTSATASQCATQIKEHFGIE